MQKLPVVSGDKVIKMLIKLGYSVVRQKGSHVRLTKSSSQGVHDITVPKHPSVAKGTLNDILSRVSLWNMVSRDDLVKMLKKM